MTDELQLQFYIDFRNRAAPNCRRITAWWVSKARGRTRAGLDPIPLLAINLVRHFTATSPGSSYGPLKDFYVGKIHAESMLNGPQAPAASSKSVSPLHSMAYTSNVVAAQLASLPGSSLPLSGTPTSVSISLFIFSFIAINSSPCFFGSTARFCISSGSAS